MRQIDVKPGLFRGHVWLAKVDSGEKPGTKIEEHVVLLQQGKYFAGYESVTVVLLTTTPMKRSYMTDVVVPRSESGSAEDVRAICGQVHTIPADRLVKYRYALSAETMQKIDEALAYGIGLVPTG
jgi:mRNA-degrading endonuclease toxin of MazEF toxin-antitoxin module